VKSVQEDSNPSERKEALKNWFVHNFSEIISAKDADNI